MAARALRQTRVRTPPQPDVPSLVVQGASLRRRPLRVRLRRPDAHRSTRSTPDTYSPGISSRPEVYRAVPRSERPAARDNDIYAPTPSLWGRAWRRAGSQLSRAELAQRTESGRSGSQPRDASVGIGRRRIAVRLSRPRAFPAYRGFWLEDRPRAQRAGTVGPTAISGTIPAVGPLVRLRAAFVRLRAGATVGGIGWR